MKLNQLIEADFSNLKDLSKHNYHGRIWVDSDKSKDILSVIDSIANSNVEIWHDWLDDSNSVYQISISGTSKEDVMNILNAVKKTNTKNTRLFWCYKSGIIKHSDWIRID